MSIKLSLIVAINNADRGIGIGGKLPWRISKGNKVKTIVKFIFIYIKQYYNRFKAFSKNNNKNC